MEADRRKVSPQLIREVTQRIVEAFNPEKVILFGSWARGDANEHSDIDLIVVMESDLSGPRRAAQVASIFGLHWWPMDIKVYTPHEYERNKKIWGTLPSLIQEECMTLYEHT